MEKLKTYIDWGQEGWDSFFEVKGKSWRDKDYRYIDEIFNLSMLEGTLLDAGCALGDGLIYLRKKCPKIHRFIGTDFSSRAIETCRNNPRISPMEFYQHNVIHPLPEKYDNIICLETLEHLEHPETAMKNLVDATNKLLIVGVPYCNRRPDQNHFWSFNEKDFSDFADYFCLDRSHKNIYFLIDKDGISSNFCRKRQSFLRNLIRKLKNNAITSKKRL
jgi:SAM-dependent methyltransferase